MSKIYFQGTFGAYSHLAALSIEPNAEIIPCKTFDECFLRASKDSSSKIIIPESGFLLEPGKLYLGRTLEYTKTKKFVPMLEGRSSIGRLGMFVHITAGFGDVGFEGFWTLEIFVVQPLKIYPNVEICQIYFHTIDGDYNEYKSGKYQANKGIQPSYLYKDFLKK